jgi:hypothetical protein
MLKLINRYMRQFFKTTSTQYLSAVLIFLGIFWLPVFAGTLSCSITTAVGCTGTVVLRMSSTSNATAELPTLSGASYVSNVICCTGVSGFSTSCSGLYSTVLKLSSSTNAHVEQNDQSNYSTSTCISVSVGSTTIAYQSSNCTGYDTTLGSISGTTNAHVGDASAYTTKICGTATDVAPPQTLTFSISTNTVNFGYITAAGATYASSTGQGSATEVTAHTFSVATNAASGYMVTVKGQTLTSQQNTAYTINAIGGTNTTSSIGTEQFGLRIATSSGTGLITSPYAASGFAYGATATTTSQVASGAGDDVTTVFSVRYLVNMAGTTESGTYTSNLVYVATANF